MTTADEFKSINAARNGSIDAFAELVRIYEQPVLRLAYRITGSEQQSCFIYREAFLAIYSTRETFRFDRSVQMAVYRAVTRLCLDYLRTRELQPSRRPAAANTRPWLEQALETLTPRERMVFELKQYHGQKLLTVSEVLHTTEDVARNILVRALQKIRAFAPIDG